MMSIGLSIQRAILKLMAMTSVFLHTLSVPLFMKWIFFLIITRFTITSKKDFYVCFLLFQKVLNKITACLELRAKALQVRDKLVSKNPSADWTAQFVRLQKAVHQVPLTGIRLKNGKPAANRFLCTRIIGNKKVLRERKMHTDRSVSSTPYAVLSRRGGRVGTLGYPLPPTWSGGYLGWGGGGVGTLGYPLPPVLTSLGGGGGRYLGWGE